MTHNIIIIDFNKLICIFTFPYTLLFYQTYKDVYRLKRENRRTKYFHIFITYKIYIYIYSSRTIDALPLFNTHLMYAMLIKY